MSKLQQGVQTLPRFHAFDPRAEIVGNTVLAFITNIMHAEIKRILENHGLDEIEADKWYLIQNVLDVMNDISQETDASASFVSIGIAAAQLSIAKLPAEALSVPIDQFFMTYEKIYLSKMRYGDVGWITPKRISAHHLTIEARSPFPDDVMYGVFYGYIRALRPSDKGFTLKYDDDHLRHDFGGESTLYHLLIDR